MSKLRDLRKQAGLSQEALARLADINPKTIKRLEKEPEKIAVCREYTINAISQALKCKPEDLIEND